LRDEPLFEPDFLARVAALRTRAGRRGDEAGAGARGASRGVAGFDLADFRAYAPGDDPRSIDWPALARLDEPVVRVFRDVAPPELVVLLDRSPSMRFGSPTKDVAARRLAGALGALAIASGARARIAGDASASSRPEGWLAAVERAPKMDRAVDETVRRAAGGGAGREWVFLSDLYDADDLGAALERARRHGSPALVVAVRAREDLEPPAEGDLVDAESGEHRAYAPSSRDEFVRRREAFDAAWRDRCARLRVPLVAVRSEDPWPAALRAALGARER